MAADRSRKYRYLKEAFDADALRTRMNVSPQDLSMRLVNATIRHLERKMFMPGFDWNPDYDLCFKCGQWWPVVLMKRSTIMDLKALEYHSQRHLCIRCERKQTDARRKDP